MEAYIPLLATNVFTLITGVLVALIAANRGLKGYRQQKVLDRKEDLRKRRQQEYERYLGAWTKAGRFKEKKDAEKHKEAEAEYHSAHDNLLLVASERVISAANNFHRYYVNSNRVDPRQVKMLYAETIIAMRKDSFEETELSVEEVARNIPWTVGDEDVNPIDWTPRGEIEQPDEGRES